MSVCISVDKPETIHKLHMIIPVSGWWSCSELSPCAPLSLGKPFFRKWWVMFGHCVCWPGTLRTQSALLKAWGLPRWSAENDRQPERRAPKYRRHNAYLVAAAAYWKWTQHVVLWRAAAQPGSLRLQTRVNKHKQLHKHFGWARESPRTTRY